MGFQSGIDTGLIRESIRIKIKSVDSLHLLQFVQSNGLRMAGSNDDLEIDRFFNSLLSSSKSKSCKNLFEKVDQFFALPNMSEVSIPEFTPRTQIDKSDKNKLLEEVDSAVEIGTSKAKLECESVDNELLNEEIYQKEFYKEYIARGLTLLGTISVGTPEYWRVLERNLINPTPPVILTKIKHDSKGYSKAWKAYREALAEKCKEVEAETDARASSLEEDSKLDSSIASGNLSLSQLSCVPTLFKMEQQVHNSTQTESSFATRHPDFLPNLFLLLLTAVTGGIALVVYLATKGQNENEVRDDHRYVPGAFLPGK